MKELLEYRVNLIDRLEKGSQEFCLACESINDPLKKVGGEWTLHQIASHTRDVEKLVYGPRILQTLHEVNPEFKSFDADEWMAAHYNKDEPISGILDEFSKNCDELCKILRSLPQEAWSRVSRHETIGGELTLQLWAERSLAHIEEHLQTLKKA
ncbi:MAG TPA: DinB family protein [Anaerolineales bacterium]|nr:DinB family protein [Anaerolineales bacterium]